MSESTTEDGKIDRKAVTYGRNILTVGVRKPYGRTNDNQILAQLQGVPHYYKTLLKFN